MSAPAREIKGSKWSKKSTDGSYGLSAELKRKQDAKYDHGLEAAIREWVEDTLVCFRFFLNKIFLFHTKKFSKRTHIHNTGKEVERFLS